MDYLEKFVHKDFIKSELMYSEDYHYLDKYINDDIFTIANETGKKAVKQNRTIWIFWMQGMERAPKVVRRCYDSICRNMPKDFDLILLSAENLSEYIQLPEFIWTKYNQGYISTTHLSDLIRLELLCTYGGCWIDATVFCSGPMPAYMVDSDMFMFRASLDNVVLKMSSWWISADKSNRLIHATRNVLYRFWKEEIDVHNYFLIHLIMSKIIDENSTCHAVFYGMPYFYNGQPHVLYGKMSSEFNEKEWNIIKDISMIHKLSYKHRFVQGDTYNYYQALLDGRLI